MLFDNMLVSSPRTWGCFPFFASPRYIPSVFPTHVGVFPEWFKFLAHAFASSPRTWGCFQPRRDGRERREGLPHARGGVSASAITGLTSRVVFPTHVGVFPECGFTTASRTSLPHARGGVSRIAIKVVKPSWSSPRTWGCFYHSGKPIRKHFVFPTHVGVFLAF